MKRLNKGNVILWSSLFVSLFGVIVAASTTAAWFQINTTTSEVTDNNDIVSGSADITIGNVYGHKIVPELSPNTGFTDYSNSTVTKMSGNLTIESTNIHQDDEDIEFDVPSAGIGYYLIKRNAAGNFKYTSSTSYKFNEYSDTTKAYVDITSGAGDVYRVKKYTFSNNKTVNTQYVVSTSGGSSSIDADTNDIVNLAANTYRVWLDYSTAEVQFEPMGITSYGATVRSMAHRIQTPVDQNIDNNNILGGIEVLPNRASKPSTVKTIGLRLSGSFWGSADAYYTAHVWGGTAGTTWPGVAFDGNAKVSGSGKIIYADVSAYTGFTNIIIARWKEAGHSTEWNRWTLNSFSANSYNFFDNNEWSSCNKSKDYDPGYYLFGAWGGDNSKFNIANAIASDASPVSGNVASWSSVTFTQSDYFKVAYYNMGGGINYQNNGFSGNHYGFGWNSADYAGNNIYCTSAPSGTYKVFLLNDSYKVAINKDVTISCYKILGSNSAVSLGSVTGNTDILLKDTSGFSAKFPSIDHYTLDSYYSNSNKATQIYPTTHYPTGNMSVYCYYRPDNQTITLYAVFYVRATSSDELVPVSISTEQIDTDTQAYDTTYSQRTTKQADKYKADSTNGIYYKFEHLQESGSYKWYSDSDCETAYTNSTVRANFPLYAKYVATLSDHTTFYIDITDANTSGVNNSAWGSVSIMHTDDNGKFVDAVNVGPHIYRATLPNDYEFRLGNGYEGLNTQNYSTKVKDYRPGGSNNLPSANSGKILYVAQAASNTNHDYHWRALKSTATYGTATIKISSDKSTWKDPVTGSTSVFSTTMDFGDGDNNYFIYEHGVQIPSGWYIDVVVESDEIADGHYGLVSNGYYVIPSDRPYLSDDDTYIQTAEYTGNARFNLYISNDGKLYIAMVPDLGNGYYIMNYDEDLGTNNFINGIKMATSSDYTASYSGYHASQDEEIFIRSYVNAVDQPCDALTDNTDGSVCSFDSLTGVITFDSPGYYNIDVTGTRVTISDYEVSDFFKLNPLDKTGSNAATRDAIKAQKTALCLEVEFTCNNSYDSRISLDVSNGIVYNSTKYTGVALYVTKTRSEDMDTPKTPYDFMRDNYYGQLSTNASIADQHTDFYVAANDTATYRAYIFIDYMPGNASYWSNYPGSGNMQFTLRSTQR